MESFRDQIVPMARALLAAIAPTLIVAIYNLLALVPLTLTDLLLPLGCWCALVYHLLSPDTFRSATTDARALHQRLLIHLPKQGYSFTDKDRVMIVRPRAVLLYALVGSARFDYRDDQVVMVCGCSLLVRSICEMVSDEGALRTFSLSRYEELQ